MRKLLFIILIFNFFPFITASGQELHFGNYGDYSLTVQEVTNGKLNFGQILTGTGAYSLGINESKRISIKGVEYVDVIVDVNGPPSLYLNGNTGYAGNSSKTIPFTLKASFANNKGTPKISKRKFITTISNNSFTRQFPILERQFQPIDPPPDPPTNAFEQSKVQETAYLYLYGRIDVGDVDPGYYSGTITINVTYD